MRLAPSKRASAAAAATPPLHYNRCKLQTVADHFLSPAESDRLIKQYAVGGRDWHRYADRRRAPMTAINRTAAARVKQPLPGPQQPQPTLKRPDRLALVAGDWLSIATLTAARRSFNDSAGGLLAGVGFGDPPTPSLARFVCCMVSPPLFTSTTA